MESFKKEILFALIFGTIVGLGAVLWFTGSYKNIPNSIFKIIKPSSLSNSTTLVVTPTPQINISNFLNINSPINEEVIATSSAKITGQAKSNLNILVISENEENIITTDKEGRFSTQVTLNLGINLIRLQPIDKKEDFSKDLTIFYFPSE